MDRRTFLAASAASVAASLGASLAASLAGCTRSGWIETTPRIDYPGMREGHALRDHAALPPPSGAITTDVAILGSGAAGLSCAWQLARAGQRDFVVLAGPEFGGNAAGGRFGELAYPQGAHYLPLPSAESTHLREMLADLGVIEADALSTRPVFDERVLVHAPDERLFIAGRWQDGIVPTAGLSADELAQQTRFFAYTDALRSARGADGRKVFCIPLAESSRDARWRALDTRSFRQWLLDEGYTAPSLHWYLNYCCRDDYGAGYGRVSAWAGLHYFAARGGHARNASDGAVLTWPDGLHSMVTKLCASISARTTPHAGTTGWLLPGFAVRAMVYGAAGQATGRADHVGRDDRASRAEHDDRHDRRRADHAGRAGHAGPTTGRAGVELLCARVDSNGALSTFTLHARRVVCAMPLFVAARVFGQWLNDYGFDPARDLPPRAPWLVSNFLLDGMPAEAAGVPLAWDNVVYGGAGLGYVVSTHQLIRLSPPTRSVFSAYQAFDQPPDTASGDRMAYAHTPDDARRWLEATTPDALREQAAIDLHAVYGRELWKHASALEITVRGHAMATPDVGFLSRPGLLALRDADGPVLFAHADLSGLSLFEEASYWGIKAARRVLGES